jgi:hypothetical protein
MFIVSVFLLNVVEIDLIGNIVITISIIFYWLIKVKTLINSSLIFSVMDIGLFRNALE